VGKPETKRPLRGPRRRRENNIKMDLEVVGGVVGTGCSWLRIGTGGGTCGYGEELSISINAGNSLTSSKFTVSFSRWTLLHGVGKYYDESTITAPSSVHLNPYPMQHIIIHLL
jgi:hypothetical protein